MKYRTLGSTGLNVSVVGIGTWQYGGEWGKEFTQDEVDAIITRGRELGVNLIDTAECYGDHASEAYIGRALKNIGGDRSDWVIATKFGHHFKKPFERTEPREPSDIRKQLEDSLRSLQTDHVDLLQYHSWGDEDFFRDDVLAELGKLKDQGKFRHLGNSVGKNTNVKQVAASKERGIEFIQIIYNRLDKGPEGEVFDICARDNLGVLARVPLASGFLSGKYKPGHAFDKDEVRGKWKTKQENDEKLREVEQIKTDEYEKDVNPDRTGMASWALAWCLKHPAVTSVIPGCKNVEQVESNAAAASLQMVS
jgi:aryl-alcohol dehydrogenase-like predicted oxidoreductase